MSFSIGAADMLGKAQASLANIERQLREGLQEKSEGDFAQNLRARHADAEVEWVMAERELKQDLLAELRLRDSESLENVDEKHIENMISVMEKQLPKGSAAQCKHAEAKIESLREIMDCYSVLYEINVEFDD